MYLRIGHHIFIKHILSIRNSLEFNTLFIHDYYDIHKTLQTAVGKTHNPAVCYYDIE